MELDYLFLQTRVCWNVLDLDHLQKSDQINMKNFFLGQANNFPASLIYVFIYQMISPFKDHLILFELLIKLCGLNYTSFIIVSHDNKVLFFLHFLFEKYLENNKFFRNCKMILWKIFTVYSMHTVYKNQLMRH